MRNRFFIQITIVLLAAGIFSSLYYYSICRELRQAKEGMPAKLNHIFYDKAKYDALFVGSSRVLRNIDPIYFDSLTGVSSYNAGVDGANFTLIDLLVRKYFKSHGSPKYVFINLDTYTMEQDTSFFYYPQFLPHIGDPDLMCMKEKEPNLKTGSHYPFIGISYFNDYFKEVAFYTRFNMCPASDSLWVRKGFMPAMDTTYYGEDGAHAMKFVFVKQKLDQLDSLCRFCTERSCKVFFIMAPIYRSIDTGESNAATYYPTIRSIENKYGISEFNFYTDRSFPKSMFLNLSHLNFIGAHHYTQLLADSFALKR
jgi:hypothetical protein